jgi:hypothetical protein
MRPCECKDSRFERTYKKKKEKTGGGSTGKNRVSKTVMQEAKL